MVSGDPHPVVVGHAQIGLSPRIPLLGGLEEPVNRPGLVLSTALAQGVHRAEAVLRRWQTLVRSS